jgi:hypothetical protein
MSDAEVGAWLMLRSGIRQPPERGCCAPVPGLTGQGHQIRHDVLPKLLQCRMMPATPTQQWQGVDAALFERTVKPHGRPAILSGLVLDWWATKAGRPPPVADSDDIKGFP